MIPAFTIKVLAIGDDYRGDDYRFSLALSAFGEYEPFIIDCIISIISSQKADLATLFSGRGGNPCAVTTFTGL